MNTENIIRSQARESLKGNWIAAVSGVFVILAAIFLVDIHYSALVGIFNVFDEDKLNPDMYLTLFVIICNSFVFAFLLTPFKNGFIRLCYNIATERGKGLEDVFYFFKGTKRYFNALQFNIIITFKFLVYILIGLIPYIVCEVLTNVFAIYITPTITAIQFTDVIKIILFVLGIVCAVIYSFRLIINEFLFADCGEINVFYVGKVIAKNHIGAYYKLIFTFLLWIASCFFVLPCFYVVPYFTTSLATTSKWLIKLYKEGKTV